MHPSVLPCILAALLLFSPPFLDPTASADPSPIPSTPPDRTRWNLPPLLLIEVLSHAPRDNELVVLGNPGTSPVEAFGWTLTDGEGRWTLPSLSIRAGQTILVTRNATSLWEDAGRRADACVRGCPRTLTAEGTLALRNDGDTLQLLDPTGRPVDAFLFGEGEPVSGWEGSPVPTPARGYVSRRQPAAQGWEDTNTSADWSWDRSFRLGQSRRTPVSFQGVRVLPLLSPEDGLDKLLALLGNARRRIDLAGFTLTQPELAAGLREALGRGVRVQVGLESSPPGGMPREGDQIVMDLQRAGARMLLMGSNGGEAWRRYALHHAKYLVLDDVWVVAGSENFSPNGFPSGPGNRGWGVAAYDPDLAAWFREVWEEDWDPNRSDVRALPLSPASPEAVRLGRSPPAFGPVEAEVTAFLSPDSAASDAGLLGVLREARERVDVELFYLRWEWGEAVSPLVEALLDAAERGVTTRILLDGQPYNVGGERGNDEAVRRLNRIAADRGLPLTARLFPGDPDAIVKVHNKGLLVDGTRVWISSMNWNEAGAFANREAGLLVRSSEIVSVFQEAFEADWHEGIALGVPAAVDEPPALALLGIGAVSGAAAAAWWWVLRTTKEASNKRPRKGKGWLRRSKQPSSPSRRRRSRSTRTAR